MAQVANLMQVPADLPVPIDDGACDHLSGTTLPSISLQSTQKRLVDLSKLKGLTVVYCYPRTGRPDVAIPPGWDQIPGARGCTPQTCAYKNHFQELKSLNVQQLFGLSTQDTDYQQEAASRLQLPFELLSDVDLKLTKHLNLPTFEYGGMILTKRLTLLINDGKIIKVFYPVFPTDRDAENVIKWLKNKQ